jgi:hypothetical protein
MGRRTNLQELTRAQRRRRGRRLEARLALLEPFPARERRRTVRPREAPVDGAAPEPAAAAPSDPHRGALVLDVGPDRHRRARVAAEPAPPEPPRRERSEVRPRLIVYATRGATEDYRRLGGTRVLENAVADALVAGSRSHRWGHPGKAPALTERDQYVYLDGTHGLLCCVVRREPRSATGMKVKRVVRVVPASPQARRPEGVRP